MQQLEIHRKKYSNFSRAPIAFGNECVYSIGVYLRLREWRIVEGASSGRRETALDSRYFASTATLTRVRMV